MDVVFHQSVLRFHLIHCTVYFYSIGNRIARQYSEEHYPELSLAVSRAPRSLFISPSFSTSLPCIVLKFYLLPDIGLNSCWKSLCRHRPKLFTVYLQLQFCFFLNIHIFECWISVDISITSVFTMLLKIYLLTFLRLNSWNFLWAENKKF